MPLNNQSSLEPAFFLQNATAFPTHFYHALHNQCSIPPDLRQFTPSKTKKRAKWHKLLHLLLSHARQRLSVKNNKPTFNK